MTVSKLFSEEEEFTEPNRTLRCRGLQEIIVHKEDTGRLLDNLDVRKGMGPDGVSGWALKECKDHLLEGIWEMVASSFKEGRIPLKWKRAYIIFKGGKSTEPLIYRPIMTGKQRWMGGHFIHRHKKSF
ncbi:hypothetical protein E2C01_072641 [Portunus trituberculatus]|uniref:Uncharacterized protein n=1 Tax=Portunus trituberculatus TaxID=210409 RepID=A0A5B7I8D7_PORTR|nr:hypothetical protein [Portunus trituberculatus]